MDLLFMIIAYFPVLTGIVGAVSLLTYTGFALLKSTRYNALLIIGCIGVGLTLLVYTAFFLTGYLGMGPVGS